MDETKESQANILCKACGLCCTGHLFIWAKLRPAELEPAESLGLTVFRSDPAQRGFSQPCPLWQGQCTIYESPQYPHVCRSYKCKLLKEMLAEVTSLPESLKMVEQAKEMIEKLEALLPGSPTVNFRERLVEQLEKLQHREKPDSQGTTGTEFQLKAQALLDYYECVFGVDDLVEKAE